MASPSFLHVAVLHRSILPLWNRIIYVCTQQSGVRGPFLWLFSCEEIGRYPSVCCLFVCKARSGNLASFVYYAGTYSHLKQIKAAFICKMLVGVFGYGPIYNLLQMFPLNFWCGEIVLLAVICKDGDCVNNHQHNQKLFTNLNRCLFPVSLAEVWGGVSSDCRGGGI